MSDDLLGRLYRCIEECEGTSLERDCVTRIEADAAEIARLNAARDECGAANVRYVARIVELEALVRDLVQIEVTTPHETAGRLSALKKRAHSLLDGGTKP